MTGNRNINLFLWLLLGILLVWVAQPVWAPWFLPPSAAVQPRMVQARGDLAADEQNTINVFEQNSPSVVYITTVERIQNVWTRDVREVPSGTGSGFVWDKTGYIVTNNHVVEGHKTAKVRLSDKRVLDAVVVGTSPEHDLAVLKLKDAKDALPPVQVGTSNNLQVGQKVFAIGNPFGLDHTLTSGIISALGRSLEDEDGGSNSSMNGLIQTDAAINPGNSGGPLLDSAGRLIGVNVAIYSPSGASAGIGFAIPVDTVNRVVPRLIKEGRYTRPALGITMNDGVSQKITDKLDTTGVLVLNVAPDSPAARAGIRGTQLTDNDELVLGDIVQAIDDKPIKTISDLTEVLDNYSLGSKVRIKLLRDGKEELELEVTLDLLK